VGVLFHEILLGRLPPCVFNQRTLFAKINSRADTSAFELETECGDYSEEVIDFLRRCLEIEPEKRMTWHEL
jgi:serine/threonine protein kinase